MISNNKHTHIPQELLRILLDNTREIFLVVNHRLEIVLFNQRARSAARALLDVELQSGNNVLDLADEDKRSWMELVYQEALQGNEKTIRYPVGDITYKVTFSPIFNTNREVDHILLSCLDVTYEEEAVELIRDKQWLLQQAESIAGLGSWEWDIPTNSVLWSDELYRIMDLEPGSLQPTKKLGFSVVHPEDVELAANTLLHTLNTGEPYSVELRLVTPKSNLKYILCQGIVTRNNNGEKHKLIGTFLDITDKKLLEDSLRNQDQRFRSLVENSSDLIIQVDENRLISYCSPAAKSMLNFEPSDLVGKRLFTLAYPGDLPRLQEELLHVLQTSGVPFVTEYRSNKKDGGFVWVEATVTNLLHVPGVESIVINQRDISQRKHSEELMQQLNRTLESRASELSTSNAELERFAYIASHDLQEPLRMVSSFLGLLQKKYNDSLDDKARQYIHFAVDGAHRMKLLINDLLEYSRTGNQLEKEEQLDMNKLVKSVCEVFKKEVAETGGSIAVDELPVINGRKTEMVQLFQNLVGNAVKYRSDEPPEIKITSSETEREWFFSITDNGIGIPAKFSEDVFNIFHRLHSKNEYEGTGIGLAICKKIIDAYGGKIGVKPADKRGSTFYFTIPKKKP